MRCQYRVFISSVGLCWVRAMGRVTGLGGPAAGADGKPNGGGGGGGGPLVARKGAGGGGGRGQPRGGRPAPPV